MVDDAATARAAREARAEWRAEQEQWSRAAFEQWEHGRTLVDVVRDCMHRGDRVTVAYATQTWAGRVDGVGVDVVCLRAGDALVDVKVDGDATFVLGVHADTGAVAGHRGAVTRTSFAARLRELDGALVSVGGAIGAVEGVLRVGADQVRLTASDGAVRYVAAGSVAWVRVVDVD
jgi:hypothetical protein